MSLSEARASLSTLVHDIENLRRVAITVRGDVRAWLVAPSVVKEKPTPRRRLRGSLKLTGKPAPVSSELEEAALRRARRAGLL